MDETVLVRAILARLARSRAAGVRVGAGDDAAILTPEPGKEIAATTDALVEGVHFDLTFQDAESVGEKLVEVNLSDLAAMGAEPRWLLVSIVVPSGRGEIVRTMLEAAATRAEAHDAAIVGGNIASGGTLTLSATALGPLDTFPLTRAGARPGDSLYLTGPTGLARVGLEALRAGRDEPAFAEAIARFRTPTARIEHGITAARFAHAAIDVSDGLVLDVSRLAESSGAGARLRLADVPRARETAELARALGLDPDVLLASGGEDYELLIAAAPEEAEAARAIGLTAVGEVVVGAGVAVTGLGGSRYEGPTGFVHET